MQRRISLAEIADNANCSVSTVSLALRDDRRLKATTRQRITRIAAELGYRPNPLLASLASNRFRAAPGMKHSSLAFLTQNQADIAEEDRLHKAGKQAAASMGYSLTRYSLTELVRSGNPSRMLYQRGTEGLILSNFFRMEALPQLDLNPFSIIALGEEADRETRFLNPSLHRVAYDHFYSVQRCWAEAIKAGYRRIGIVLFEHPAPVSDDILRYASALMCQSYARERDRIPILRKLFDQRDVEILKAWMEKYRPEAVVGFNQIVSFYLREIGKKIPDDVAFVSLHREAISVGEAGMQYTTSSMISAAIEYLDQQIRHRYRGVPEDPRTVLIHQKWIAGPTLPALR